MNWKHTVILAIGISGTTSASMAQSNDPVTGLVFTESNQADNSVLEFDRTADGALSLAATVPTGGAGGGVVSVGSQGSVAVSQSQQYIFAANEGGNSISVLKRTATGLTQVGTVSSGGTLPVSITVSGNLVYVLNDGVSGSSNASITGFTFNNSTGVLTPIANSTRSLSAPSPTLPAVGPIAPQIQFDNTGHVLLVTETGTSLIDAYTINANGTPSQPLTQTSLGSSPFALAFTPQNNLLVTEVQESLGTALQGATTSYQLSSNGTLTPISGSVVDFQTAPCWIVVTPDGKFAYVVNTASGVISGYQVGSNGELSLLGNGVTAATPPGPLDDVFLDGDLFDVTSGGSIIGFQVQADGALTSLDLSATVPAGSRGLVAIAVPEPSTWAMMLLGFVGLAALGARKVRAATAAG
jgi:6-phosphogluconolactonase (cycloisomerase 2 family)